MMLALSHYLMAEDSAKMFPFPKWMMRWGILPIARLLNGMPEHARGQLVRVLGNREGMKPKNLRKVDAEAVAAEVVSNYPEGKYPAIAVGSANGAAVMMAAAMGIPWLPQTFLTLCRRELKPPDVFTGDPAFGAEYGQPLLDANPGVSLAQMCDPANDRHMSRHMAYFRVKHMQLPQAYRDFIRRNLEPGGSLILFECGRKWPGVKTGDRLSYQVGGVGGTTVDEYLRGSERIRKFLTEQKSPFRRFHLPEITGDIIEAEWGFDPRLRTDTEKFARQENFGLRRLVFQGEEDASPFVSDLIRWWYQEQGVKADTLLVQDYAPFEIRDVLRTATVPYWMVFNGENSLRNASRYVSTRNFRNVLLHVFSNHVDAPGIPRQDNWAREVSPNFVGTQPEKIPFDLTSAIDYYFDLAKKLPAPTYVLNPLTINQVDTFVRHKPPSNVSWLDPGIRDSITGSF